MPNEILKLKFEGKEQEYTFENKVCVVDDKDLISNLKKENIKNEDSTLVISSLNNLQIADVIQFKINLAQTGYFLVNFQKDQITEEKRELILNKIKELKDDSEPTTEKQFEKIKKLLGILGDFNPIYVSFLNKGEILIPIDELLKLEVKYPLLVLKSLVNKQPKKITKINIDKSINVGFKIRIKIDFDLFRVDYIFCIIFAILGTFGITTGVFEIMNKESLATFLLILATIFIGVLTFCIYSCVYKKGKANSKGLRYYLILFVCVGIALGITIAYFVSKFVLKTKIDNFDFSKWTSLSILISSGVLLLTIPLIRLVNIIYKSIKKHS